MSGIIILRIIILILIQIYYNYGYMMKEELLQFIILFIIINCYLTTFIKYSMNNYMSIAFALGGLSLLGMNNLFALYITMELISLITYTYLYKPFGYENILNIIYYFIINSLSGLLFLYSIFLIYRDNGETASYQIYEIGITPLSIIIITMLIKLGLGPFYFWKINLYRKLTTKELLFVSIIPNLFYLYLTYHFIFNWSFSSHIFVLITIFILFSIFIVIISFLTNSLFNILILYSSIFNISLSLFNIYLAYYHLEQFNILFYFFIYNINILAFLYLVYLSNKHFYNNILYYPLFILSCFSFIGFPPTAGFYAKYYLLYKALETNDHISYLFSFVIIISSIILAILYLKLIQYISFYPLNLTSYTTNNPYLYSSLSYTTIFLYSFYFLIPYIPII